MSDPPLNAIPAVTNEVQVVVITSVEIAIETTSTVLVQDCLLYTSPSPRDRG